MFERLKQYPLVGLSLAIAAGYVLAHVIIETGDNLYENDPDLLANLALWALAAGIVAAVVWQRRLILDWLGHHKREAWIGACSVGVLCSALIFIAVSYQLKSDVRQRAADAEDHKVCSYQDQLGDKNSGAAVSCMFDRQVARRK